MTRREFIENPPSTIGELIEFCQDNDLNSADNIIPSEDLDEHVCEDIRDVMSNEYWTNVRDYLNDIEEGYSWYYRDGIMSYTGYDDSWEDLYDAVVDEMDNRGWWDEEEDEEEDEDEIDWGEMYDEDDSDPCDTPEDEFGTEEIGVFSIDSLIDSDLITVVRAEAEDCDRKRQEALSNTKFAIAESRRMRSEAAAREDEERARDFWSTFESASE